MTKIGRGNAIEHFSQRRAEIVAALAERGVSSPAAAEVAAYRTREAKDYGVDADNQRADWLSRAEEFGLTAASIERLPHFGAARKPQMIEWADCERAIDDLEASRSHFDRRDLLCALANQLTEGASAFALDEAVETMLAGERVIEVAALPGAGKTTALAAALAELAEGCDGKLVCIGDPRQIGAVGPGGLYGHLTSEIEPSVLTEIRRQRDPLDRRIVELAHEGRGSDALDLLHTRERLVIADTMPEALDALVHDWHERFEQDSGDPRGSGRVCLGSLQQEPSWVRSRLSESQAGWQSQGVQRLAPLCLVSRPRLRESMRRASFSEATAPSRAEVGHQAIQGTGRAPR